MISLENDKKYIESNILIFTIKYLIDIEKNEIDIKVTAFNIEFGHDILTHTHPLDFKLNIGFTTANISFRIENRTLQTKAEYHTIYDPIAEKDWTDLANF